MNNKVDLHNINQVQNFDFEVKTVAQIKQMPAAMDFNRQNVIYGEDVLPPTLRIPMATSAADKMALRGVLDPEYTGVVKEETTQKSGMSKAQLLMLAALGLLAVFMGGG